MDAQNDLLGGLYPGMQSLSHCQSQFYAHVLSLNGTIEHDIHTVSGFICSATPISIAWEVQGVSTALANRDKQATNNGYIWATGASSSTLQQLCVVHQDLECVQEDLH